MNSLRNIIKTLNPCRPRTDPNATQPQPSQPSPSPAPSSGSLSRDPSCSPSQSSSTATSSADANDPETDTEDFGCRCWVRSSKRPSKRGKEKPKPKPKPKPTPAGPRPHKGCWSCWRAQPAPEPKHKPGHACQYSSHIHQCPYHSHKPQGQGSPKGPDERQYGRLPQLGCPVGKASALLQSLLDDGSRPQNPAPAPPGVNGGGGSAGKA